MLRKFPGLTVDGIVLALTLVLANLRALMFFTLYPDTSQWLGSAWIEIAFWFLAVLGIAYILIRDHRFADYLSLWRENWLTGLFIFLAFISAFWSLGFSVTLFRSLELLFAALIASYLGLRCRPQEFMEILFWFGAVMLILSIALVYAAPKTGTMYWAPFYGAWRGVYWHRNHLGSMVALLSVIFLCRAVIALENRNTKGILDVVFYILSLVVLYFAKSVTGYILFIVLHFFGFCVWLWLRYRQRLQRGHYYIISGVFLAATILTLLNLDFIFGLFNRSSTLTGRVFLWDGLWRDVIPQRLWWGHGFGAAWTLDSFREEMKHLAGWTSQPLISDNGFLDILLHLGMVGLLLFLGILFLASIRSFRYALSQKTLADFFPLLVMLYAFVANIAFSLFAESEVFVWLLIVVVLFMTTPVKSRLGSDQITD